MCFFFKVTPEDCRLPGWRRPEETRWEWGGVGWRDEYAGCCWPGHQTTGVWMVRPTSTPAGTTDHSRILSVDGLEGSLR